MKKLQALHEYLLGTGLVDADQLRTFSDQGRIIFYISGEHAGDVAFLRSYQAEISVLNFGGDPDKLDAALVWWLGVYHPELAGGENGYGFEAEILSKESVNLHLTLPLSERVTYKRATDEMRNCVKPLVWDAFDPLEVPLFLMDADGTETELAHG